MTERDRFGDKLKEKERAEEDRFFAERDRALLDKIRAENDKSKSDTEKATAPRGRCPKCATPLVERTVTGVEIDECTTCLGVWLEAGELEALSKRESGGWIAQMFRRSVVNTR
jgi:uncharacterized protein